MPARANASKRVVAAKRSKLSEPHIAPLVALADEIAAARGMQAGMLPYPDPELGGVYARALFLLSTPGPYAKAEHSGLLSLENDDPTAERQYNTYRAVGLDMGKCVHWNAVPWPTAERTPTGAEQRDAFPWLVRLMRLFTQLRVVVVLG